MSAAIVAQCRKRLRSLLIALTITSLLSLSASSVAVAHTWLDEYFYFYGKCISNAYYGVDPDCKAHWEWSRMTYRWGTIIDDADHGGHRNAFVYGANTWEFGTNPTVPWYESYSSGSSTVVDIRNTNEAIGTGLIASPNSEFHIPMMVELWLKHDIETEICSGQACSWYTGTGSPSQYQYDEWSAWTHELGHAQNLSHQSVDSHTSHDHTMRPELVSGTTSKRTLSQHEKVHACKPYELSHNDIVCGSL